MARLGMLVPLSLSVVYLAVVPFAPRVDDLVLHAVVEYAQLGLLFALPVALLVLARVHPAHAPAYRRFAMLSPCVLAPLAVLHAWTVGLKAPGTFGGFCFFLHWLTKYPNLGPVNWEVLLGILCVLGSSFIPALFALYAVSRAPRRLVVLILVAGGLLCYGAVLVYLDFGMLHFVATMMFVRPMLVGPVLRAAGVGAMLVVAMWMCFGRKFPAAARPATA